MEPASRNACERGPSPVIPGAMPSHNLNSAPVMAPTAVITATKLTA